MRVECSYCKRNLTSEALKLLEGKIKKIICKCKTLTINNIKLKKK